MDGSVVELRAQVRTETLRELALIAEGVGPLTAQTLREMAGEVETARTSLALLAAVIEPEHDDDGYELNDPKSEGFHGRQADAWDMREGK